MEYKQYISYSDIFKKDVSSKDSLRYIKLIFGKYRKLLILNFLSYVSMKIGVIPSQSHLRSVQKEFDINVDGITIHQRSVLVLYQIYYETIKFNSKNTNEVIEANDVLLLFLYANQILSKTDIIESELTTNEINTKILMMMMKIYVGVISAYDLNIMIEYYLAFYEKLLASQHFGVYDIAIKAKTNLKIVDFIEILKNIKNHHKLNKPFETFDKFSVLKYSNMNEIWNNRVPKLDIPNEYRFFEQYPMIKNENLFYGVPPLILFLSLIRKPYHLLSSDDNTKKYFRADWGKQIIEPVIKFYIRKIFENEEVRIIDFDFQNNYGFEPSDIIIVFQDNIILLEIKSGYMALEDRYNSDEQIFKDSFENKYVYSGKKHQLINQLKILNEKYDLIFEKMNLKGEIKYKVHSGLLVFDEALSLLGFKRYLAKIFNEHLTRDIKEVQRFNIFEYSNLITFAELLSIERRINNKDKRIHFLRDSFHYMDSIHELFEDIKSRKIEANNISIEDIS